MNHSKHSKQDCRLALCLVAGLAVAALVGPPEVDGAELAYLDPGAASMLWYAVSGTIIAAFVAIQSRWKRLRTLVRQRLGHGGEPGNGEQAEG